jgi:hypothetical protein
MAEDRLMNGQAYAAALRPQSIHNDGWVTALAPPALCRSSATEGIAMPLALAQAAAAGAAHSLMSGAASPSRAPSRKDSNSGSTTRACRKLAPQGHDQELRRAGLEEPDHFLGHVDGEIAIGLEIALELLLLLPQAREAHLKDMPEGLR